MRLLISIVLAVSILSACKRKTKVQPAPTASELILPAENETCTTGTIVSDTENKVILKWKAANNATAYEVHIKNLSTTTSVMYPVTGTEIEVLLKRNTPYSWHVISKSENTTSTAKSSVWKFYNPGPSQVSHPPFPADILSPTLGETLAAGTTKVTLDWNCTDVDGDITSYDIYLGTESNPPLKTANLVPSILTNVDVKANTVYYWKVVTRDSKGNASNSEISEFKVN